MSGFVTKWAQARLEFALALRFLRGPTAPARSAFACLLFEMEYAAHTIADDTVAGAKLAWWAEEFVRLGERSPQHPLTRELVAHGGAEIPVDLWQRTIVGALTQRDSATPGSCDALLETYSELYLPLAEAESQALGGIDAGVAANADALNRAVHACMALPDPSSSQLSERGSVPLDVLARHGLSRHDVASSVDARRTVLQDHLSELARRCGKALAQSGGGVIRRTALAANRVRAQRAISDVDPSQRLLAEMGHLPSLTVWTAWRSARAAAPARG